MADLVDDEPGAFDITPVTTLHWMAATGMTDVTLDELVAAREQETAELDEELDMIATNNTSQAAGSGEPSGSNRATECTSAPAMIPRQPPSPPPAWRRRVVPPLGLPTSESTTLLRAALKRESLQPPPRLPQPPQDPPVQLKAKYGTVSQDATAQKLLVTKYKATSKTTTAKAKPTMQPTGTVAGVINQTPKTDTTTPKANTTPPDTATRGTCPRSYDAKQRRRLKERPRRGEDAEVPPPLPRAVHPRKRRDKDEEVYMIQPVDVTQEDTIQVLTRPEIIAFLPQQFNLGLLEDSRRLTRRNTTPTRAQREAPLRDRGALYSTCKAMTRPTQQQTIQETYMMYDAHREPPASASSSSGGHDSAPSASSAPPVVMRGDEVMANLARLRMANVRNPWNPEPMPENVPVPTDNETPHEGDAAQHILREQQRTYYEAHTMAPTTSYTDNSGWAPPYTWQPAQTLNTPAFFAHPRYLGQRVPPAMATQTAIAPEVYADIRGTAPPQSYVSLPVAQTLQSLHEARDFRTGDREMQPRTAYGPQMPGEERTVPGPARSVDASLLQNRLLLNDIQQVTVGMQAAQGGESAQGPRLFHNHNQSNRLGQHIMDSTTRAPYVWKSSSAENGYIASTATT